MPPTATATKPPAKRPPAKPRRTAGERDRARGELVTDDSLERRYHRQQQRARDRGEPTSMQELDDLERKESKQQARAELGQRFNLNNMPAGTLGIGSMMAPLVVEVVLITADEFVSYKRWPVPSRYLAAFAIFGGLSLASGTQASRAASLTAWGLVLATTYAFVTRNANILTGIGNFFGGSPSGNIGAPPSAAQVQAALAQPGATGANSEVQGPNRKIM